MPTTTSADGTVIAYDRLGEGPPVIVVGGALCDRSLTAGLATELAGHRTVLNFDRRGRGASGDTPPYAVAREIEDVGALLAAAGGSAAIYGHSSGAALGLHAAAAGLPVERLVMHEAPYAPPGGMADAARAEAAELEGLLADGRRADAVARFLEMTGMPADAVAAARDEPWFAGMEAMAHTLLYDSQVMGDAERGGTIPEALADAVGVPVLVLSGDAGPDWFLEIGERLATLLPDGRHEVLAGQEHVVPPEVLVPVLLRFL